MKAIGILGYIIIGFIQTGAMFAGFMDSLGKIFGFILALILGQCPIIGGVMGIIGAVKAWEWPWWGAALLFFGIPILLLLFNAFAFRND